MHVVWNGRDAATYQSALESARAALAVFPAAAEAKEVGAIAVVALERSGCGAGRCFQRPKF